MNFHKNALVILDSLNFFKHGREALSLNLLYKAAKFLKEGEFDIIHCHFGPNGNLGILLKKIGIKGKVITTFHGYDLTSYLIRNGNNIYDDLFSQGDLFLPVSNYWRNRLIQLGCPYEKIIVHHMGVDTDKFQFVPRTLSPIKKINVLTVARLSEKKGLEYSIKAIAKVINNYSNIEYNIVGDGPLKDELNSLIEKLEIRNHIKLLGWKVGEELEQLLKTAHIFLLHSVISSSGDMEGIPVSLMEAQSVGLPAISTHHSGIPELIQNGRSGFLVPERKIDKMAERLEYLIRNPEIWVELGKEGRKHVEAKFNSKNLNLKLVQIYQELL